MQTSIVGQVDNTYKKVKTLTDDSFVCWSRTHVHIASTCCCLERP